LRKNTLGQNSQKIIRSDARMDAKRAREIFESYGVIDVLHNNQSVWIESLNGNEAKVTYIESDKTVDVPISQLVEGDPIE
jgi:H-type small acid-soluble spore protein